MPKHIEVTVTYRVYALDENDALDQVFNHMVEPETVDVIDLPSRQKVEVDIIPF